MQRRIACLSFLILLFCALPLSAQQAGSNSNDQSAPTVSPAPQVAQKLPPTVHGNGVAGFLPLWTDTKIIGESVMTQIGNTLGVAGDMGATGNVGAGTTTPVTTLDVFSNAPGIHAPIAQFGSKGTTDSNSILTYNGTGTTEVFQVGCANCFVPGAQAGDGGMRVKPGKSLFLGDSGNARLRLDGAGNASQPRTANGMVKAMFKFSPFNGGRIITCFNSALSGSAATTPPCGFSFTIDGTGQYVFGFGFQIDDRILSLTATNLNAGLGNCTDVDCTFLTNQQVFVVSGLPVGSLLDQDLYMLVY